MKDDGTTIEVVPKGKKYYDNYDNINWNSTPTNIIDCFYCEHVKVSVLKEPCKSCELRQINNLGFGSNYKSMEGDNEESTNKD